MYFWLQRSYLSMISYADYNFGRLLRGLDSNSSLSNRTVVAVSSDHGDFGGDYGLVEKYPGAADDVLTRVPMIVRHPAGVRGKRIKSVVQTADILETFLDFAQVKSDFVRFARSQKIQILSDEEKGDMSRYVYSEGGFSFRSSLFPGGSDHVPDDPHNMYYPRAQEEMSGNGTGSPRWVMIRNVSAKLVYRPLGISELYDLSEDPRELSNIFDTDSNLRNDLMSRLMAWFVSTGDVPPLRNDPRGVPSYPEYITAETCRDVMEPDPPTNNNDASQDFAVEANDYLSINGVLGFDHHPYDHHP